MSDKIEDTVPAEPLPVREPGATLEQSDAVSHILAARRELAGAYYGVTTMSMEQWEVSIAQTMVDQLETALVQLEGYLRVQTGRGPVTLV